MVKGSEIYKGSEFLTAEDVKAKRKIKAVITKAEVETIGERDKIVLTLDMVDKRLVLNKNNYKIIEEELGDETDNWPGHIIELITTKVNYQGKLVDGMTISEVVKSGEQSPAPSVLDKVIERVVG